MEGELGPGGLTTVFGGGGGSGSGDGGGGGGGNEGRRRRGGGTGVGPLGRADVGGLQRTLLADGSAASRIVVD